MVNPFYGESIQQLLAWRAAARRELASGVKDTSFHGGDTGGTSTVYHDLTPERRIQLINAELYRQQPDVYPMGRRITRTRMIFNRCHPPPL